ncbi:M20/M25/M40 family metallo-hydrolase [Streptomyces sp. SPB074]|uniref:M20/M25/M40 family metallo-hydrolase n=1 Tax=Streptomyces sp. (strain SPB074) TaxID=465543 RepID=UPI00017F2616|nr:M20/M25/M40 family metallo-hydrolase [Streptomyces sp. SPB074]EDY45335.1 acetyl-lysine deacetylase [Streptomyces sp. SPB074]
MSAPSGARAEALLRRMVEIASPSGSEQELAAFLERELPEWGFCTRQDEVGNVLAERGPAEGPVIMLVGHMDTVPAPVAVRREGDLLYGRGTVDAKGPLATMVCAAASARTGPVRVVVAGVVEEETFGRGATHLARGPRPDAVIVGEPNGWAGVGIGYKGRVVVRYEVRRPAAHTASPEEQAADAAAAFHHAVVRYCAEHVTGPRAFDQPLPTLLRVEGTIEHARLTLAVRTPPGFDLPSFEAFLTEAAGDARLWIDDRTPAVRVDHRGAVVRALCGGVRAQGGRPRLKLKTGTADLNIVEPAWGCPAAVYGPGDSALDHTDHEHIDLREYATAIEVLRHGLEALAAELAGDAGAEADAGARAVLR